MSTLFSKVVSDARVDLNDEGSVRFTDAQMISYANDGVREIKKVRPDLFFGSYSTALSTYTISDNVPVNDLYVQFLKDYIVFRCGMREDETNSVQRTAGFYARFTNGLKAA